ncbi:hypothetical protein [Paenibacillus gansuensis]|uniref:Uncharacterized protein n=1 Tax=Paenibacillus gansuensis TaxID=306542 RepID=A0ABW5PG14_9BACL
MRRNWRYLGEAATAAVILPVLYYAWQIGAGMWMTLNYTPDMMDQYESVDYLQHKVSFGFAYTFAWWQVAFAALVLGVLYYRVRIWRAGRKKGVQ